MPARTFTLLGSAISLLALCVAQSTRNVVDCSPGPFTSTMPIGYFFPCIPSSNVVKSHKECDVFAYMALNVARTTLVVARFGIPYNPELRIPTRLLDCFLIVPGKDIATQVSSPDDVVLQERIVMQNW